MSLSTQLCPIINATHCPLASLATVLFRNGVIIDEAYLGHAQIAQPETTRSRPVDAKTKFRVASISKLVATLAIMQLVEQKKIGLDDDISDRLGFELRNPHHPAIPITLRLLLSHTSSIRDGNEQYSLPMPHTMIEFFKADGTFFADGRHWAPIEEPPGSYFCYCNLNFGLIGTLIEIASGQRFDQYMRSHIFETLGINASYNVRDFSDESLTEIAALYRKQNAAGEWDPTGQWVPQVDNYQGRRPDAVVRIENPATKDRAIVANQLTLDDYEIGTNGTLFSPQGGLRISARGLATIGMLLCNGGELNGRRILQSSSVETMRSPVWRYDSAQANGNPYGGLMRSWGLGMQIITDHSAPGDGDRLIEDVALPYVGHSGDAYGLHSGLWFDPKTSSGFVYIIGGVGADPDAWPGNYSSFYRWEEEIMTALYTRFPTP